MKIRYTKNIGPTLEVVQPVGIPEIAERLKVKRSTVDQWRQRTSAEFPKPKWTVGGRPAWDWEDVKRWAKKTGRLP